MNEDLKNFHNMVSELQPKNDGTDKDKKLKEALWKISNGIDDLKKSGINIMELKEANELFQGNIQSFDTKLSILIRKLDK